MSGIFGRNLPWQGAGFFLQHLKVNIYVKLQRGMYNIHILCIHKYICVYLYIYTYTYMCRYVLDYDC